MNPALFFCVNVLLAGLVAGFLGERDLEKLAWQFSTSVFGAIVANAALLAISGGVFRFAHRSQYEGMLAVVFYASAYYIPLSAVSLAINSQWLWMQVVGAVTSRSLSHLLWPGVTVLIAGLVAATLFILWMAFVARALPIATARDMRPLRAFVLLACVLVLLASVELVIQTAAAGVSFAELFRTTVAVNRLENDSPRYADAQYYQSGETLMRNLARRPDLSPTEKYKVVALASVLLVAQCETAVSLSSYVGEAHHPNLRGRVRQLWRLRGDPLRFEAYLNGVTEECSQASSRVVNYPAVARRLNEDVGLLGSIRSSPGFPQDSDELQRRSFTIGLMMWSTGLYVCPFPQPGSWPPKRWYEVTLTYELPGGNELTRRFPLAEYPPKRAVPPPGNTGR